MLNVCTSLIFWAGLLVLSGEADEAERLLDEVVSIQQEIGTDRHAVGVLSAKANLAFLRGELAAAEQHIQAWQELVRGRTYRAANGLWGLNLLALTGWLAGIRGDYQQGYAISRQLAATPQTRYFMFAWRCSWGQALAHYGLGNAAAARQALHEVLRLAHHSFQSSTIRHLCLPPAALLAETPQRAVELLGLASRGPQELMGWTAHWPMLAERKRDLEAVLGAQQFAAAWERGAGLELNACVEQLLGELAGSSAGPSRSSAPRS